MPSNLSPEVLALLQGPVSNNGSYMNGDMQYAPVYGQGQFSGGQDGTWMPGPLTGYRATHNLGGRSAASGYNGQNYDSYDARGNYTGSNKWKGLSGNQDWLPLAMMLAPLAMGAMGVGAGASAGAGAGLGTGAATGADLSAFYGGLDGGATLGGGASIGGGSALGAEGLGALGADGEMFANNLALGDEGLPGAASGSGGWTPGPASGADMDAFYGGTDGGATLGGGGSFTGAGAAGLETMPTLSPMAGMGPTGLSTMAGGTSGLASMLGGAGGLLGPAATLLGAAAGSRGQQTQTTSQNRLDPRMDALLYQGLIPRLQSLLDQRTAPGAQAGYDSMTRVGQSLLDRPLMGNGFSRMFPGR